MKRRGGVSLVVSGLGESGDDRDMRRVYFAEKLATTLVSGHGQPSDDEKEMCKGFGTQENSQNPGVPQSVALPLAQGKVNIYSGRCESCKR